MKTSLHHLITMKNPLRNLTCTIAGLAVLGLMLIVAPSARAANASWLGTTDALWSTAGNWSGSLIPGVGNTATFNAVSGNTTITVGTISLANITFDTINAAAYTLGATPGAGTITFGNGTTTAVTMNSAVSANETINANLTLGDGTASTTTFQNDSLGGTLALGGDITGGTGGTAAAETVIFTGAGNTVMSGKIKTGGASSVALTKTGTGTLTLSGASTYAGLTTISGGVVNIQNAAALGTTGNGTTVASGAALQIQGDIAVDVEALTLNGTGIGGTGALRNISGANTYGGLLTLGGTTRINTDSGSLNLSNTGSITGSTFGLSVGGSGTTTIAGIIGTGNGTLTKDGTGTLILSGLNTYTGATTISAGTLQLGNGASRGSIATASAIINNATLAFNTTATDQTSASVISGTGNVIKAGTGTTTITGANTYTGTTTLSGGLLTLNVAESVGVSGPMGKSAASNPGSIVFAGGTLQHTASNMFDYSGRFSTAASQAYSVNLGFSTPVTWATALTSVGGTLTKTGTGRLTLTGANTYTGITTIGAGVINLGVAEIGGVSGPLGQGGSIVFSGGQLEYSAANAVDYSGRFSQAAGQLYSVQTNGRAITWATALTGAGSSLAVSASGGSSFTLTGANTYTGATNMNVGTFVLGNGGSTGSLSPSSAITMSNSAYFSINRNNTVTQGVDFALGMNGTASSQFRQDGTGTTTLIGANTYGGETWLNAGQLNLTNAANIGTGALILAGGAFDNTSAAPITFTNALTVYQNYTFVGTKDLTFTGAVTLGATRTHTILAGNLTLTSGVVGTAKGLTKAGAGTLILSGNNTYTGTTTITGGKIVMGNALALQNSAYDTTGSTGAIGLDVTGYATPTLGGLIGSVNLTTAITGYSSVTELTLNPQAGFSNTYSGVIANGVAGMTLTKTGTGTQFLSGANTYTGLTTVSAGTLTYGINNAISTGDVTVNGAGAVLAMGTFTDSVGAVTLTAGDITGSGTLTSTSGFTMNNEAATSVSANLAGSVALTKSGAGTTTLSGANTYSGATTVTLGTLLVNGSTSASSAVTVSGGTLGGTGTVNGNATLTGGGIINKSSGAIAGTLEVTGGNWNGAGSVSGVATSSSGVFTIGSGANLTATGGLNVTGGTIAAGSSTSTITGSVNYSSSSSSSYNGVIAGAGKTLTVSNGTLALGTSGSPATQTYTGDTLVTSGTLIVNGTLQNGALTVSSGGTLKGNITAGGTTSILGTLSVGNSPGSGTFATLNLSGLNLTEFNTGALPTNPGTDFDTINVTAALSYGGELRLSFAGAIANSATAFDLFSGAAVAGASNSFASVTLYNTGGQVGGSLINVAGIWSGTANLGYGTGMQSFSFNQSTGDLIVAVPEPTTWALLAFSLTVVTVLRRRRNS